MYDQQTTYEDLEAFYAMLPIEDYDNPFEDLIEETLEDTFDREIGMILEASGEIQDALWNMDTFSYQAGWLGESYIFLTKYANANEFTLIVDGIEFDNVTSASQHIATVNL